MSAVPAVPGSQAVALPRYEEMCRAIEACYRVEEAKEIRDKTIALEAYFKQAKNTENERRACEIRLRAERKAGELLKGMEKAKGTLKRGQEVPRSTASTTETLRDLGISKNQSARWQQLADVPESDFEAALAAPKKPSTTSIVGGTSRKPMDSRALWLWGRLRDFERERILDATPQTLLADMTDAMRADVRRLAHLVAEWLEEIE